MKPLFNGACLTLLLGSLMTASVYTIVQSKPDTPEHVVSVLGMKDESVSAVTFVQENSGKTVLLNMSEVVTEGNHTFIPLDFPGKAREYASVIVQILSQFENDSAAVVTSFTVDTRHDDSRVHGLWLTHHKPVTQ